MVGCSYFVGITAIAALHETLGLGQLIMPADPNHNPFECEQSELDITRVHDVDMQESPLPREPPNPFLAMEPELDDDEEFEQELKSQANRMLTEEEESKKRPAGQQAAPQRVPSGNQTEPKAE